MGKAGIGEEYLYVDKNGETTKRATQSAIASAEGFSDLSAGALSGFSDLLYQTYMNSGVEAVNGLFDMVNNILSSEVAPDMKEQFMSAINAIDPENLDSIEGTREVLESMGIALDDITFDNLVNEIALANNAVKTFDLEKIKDELNSLKDLRLDIEDREENERTFTEEEYKMLIEANPNLAGDFVFTDIDEFTYVGDSMVDLIAALNDNTAALLGEYGYSVTDKADKSRDWEKQAREDALAGRTWSGGGLEEGTTPTEALKMFAYGNESITWNREEIIINGKLSMNLTADICRQSMNFQQEAVSLRRILMNSVNMLRNRVCIFLRTMRPILARNS